MGFKITRNLVNRMKKNSIKIKLESFIQSKKKRINQFLNQSKIFWKDVARNYKRINSVL